MWRLCVWVMKRVITRDTVRGYTGLIRPPETTYKIKAPMNMAHIKRYGKKAAIDASTPQRTLFPSHASMNGMIPRGIVRIIYERNPSE